MITRRRIALVGAIAAVLLVSLIGWRIWQVKRALSAGEVAVSALTEALRTGDDRAADRAERDLAVESTAAADGTSGPIWSALTRLPMVGDDAHAVRLASTGLALLAREAVPQLREVAAQQDDLVPQAGRVPLERAAALSGPIGRADTTVSRVLSDLETVDVGSLLGPLRQDWIGVVDRLRHTHADLDAARTAVALLPQVLGGDGSRRYLLVFENNAEVRASGGMPGTAAELIARDGRLSLGRQFTSGAFQANTPVLPLTPPEAKIYGSRLGSDFRQANWTPDERRSAAFWAAHWSRLYPAEPIDGVIAVDTVMISYLLNATGPIAVDGVALTPENAVDELLNRAYGRFPNPTDQDRFFQSVAAMVFERINGGVRDSSEFLRALTRGVSERRLFLNLRSPAEQAEIDRFAVAGTFARLSPRAPRLGAYLIDGTGSKMSYYLRSAVETREISCVDGVQRLEVTVTLRSILDPDVAAEIPDSVAGDYDEIALKRGEQLVGIRLYGPDDGAIVEVSQDGGTVQKARPVDDSGRPVSSAFVVVPPGGETAVTWRVLSGKGQTETAEVAVTPGLAAPDVEVDPSTC